MADLSAIPTDQLLGMLRDTHAQAIAEPAPKMGKLASVGTGVVDTMVNAGQTLGHGAAKVAGLMVPDYAKERTEKLDTAVENRKARITNENPREGYRTLGQVVATLPLAAIDAPVAMGVLAGATGDTKPGADFWADKFKNMALGGVLGKAGAVAGGLLGKAIAPKVAPDAAALMKEGVTLTPGQMAGSKPGVVSNVVKRGEEALQSVPVVGSLIRHGRENAIQRFNRVAVNRALSSINETLPASIPVGHDAMDYAAQKVSQAYDKVAPTITYKPVASPAYQAAMQRIQGLVSELHPDQAKQFASIYKNRIADRFSNGVMQGRDFIRANSDIGKLAREKLRSQDGNQQQLGHALDALHDELFQDLERTSPTPSAELSKVHQAYGRLQPLHRAAANRAGSDAVFTPKDLITGAKVGQTKSAISRGQSETMKFAEQAHRVLGDSVRDSGTPERQAFAKMLSGLTSGLRGEAGGAAALAGAHAVGAPLAVLAPAGLAALPYTRAGMAILQKWMQTPGPKAEMARKIVEQASRRLAPVGAGVVGSRLGQP